MSIQSFRSYRHCANYNIDQFRLNHLVVGFLLILTCVLAFRYAWVANQTVTENIIYEPIVVQSGDTLWEIAEDSGLKQDTRDTVFEIMRYNSLSDSTIVPGQVIYIPVPMSTLSANSES